MPIACGHVLQVEWLLLGHKTIPSGADREAMTRYEDGYGQALQRAQELCAAGQDTRSIKWPRT